MVVALRAPDRQAEPDGAERGGAVEQLLVAELLGIGAAFAIGEGVAIEASRDERLDVAIGEQVARELLGSELVEGQVAVERVDDPIAIAPGPRAGAVLFIAVGIGVAGEVEPPAGPLLAEVR